MKQKIINLLQNSIKPQKIVVILSKLEISNTKEKELFFSDINFLQNHNIIFKNDSNEFYIKKELDKFFVGKIQITTKGNGYIKLYDNEKEYWVSADNVNNALNNDEIIFTLSKHNVNEAKVYCIVKRSLQYLIGSIVEEEHSTKKQMIIRNLKMQNYLVNIINDKDAIKNTIVRAKIINFKDNIFNVFVDQILGNHNDPGIDILGVMYEFGIKSKFEQETLYSADKLPQTVLEKDKQNRVNLCDQLLVTIDGIDAKDFDDAISVSKLSNGYYKLIVAIADVSYYVKEKTPLDNEAFYRGNSVYLADRVVPMLPFQLSNGICSLNEQVERLCMVCEMVINNKGITISSKIYQAVMKSARRMNYDEVNLAYKGLKPSFIKTHPQIWEMLKDAFELYEILWKYKYKEGVIDFEIDEAKITVNNQGEAVDIDLKQRDNAEKLIESFMIRANEVVSRSIFSKKLPFLYRVHSAPKSKKMQQLTTILKLMGIQSIKATDKVRSKDLQILLESIKNLPNFQVLSTLLLRSMEKAIYSNKNNGHFGLASDCYTHFTSPIRRYADLTVHRLLRQYIINKNITKKTIAKNEEMIKLVAEQTTNLEIKTLECERAVEQMKKAEFMSKHIGHEFLGTISGITSFGIFVELKNTIEGLIRVSDLNDDYYIFNEKTLSLFGERKRKEYKLGQEIMVKVKNANKEFRTIDFILDIAEEANLKLPASNNLKKHWNNSKFSKNKTLSNTSKLKKGKVKNDAKPKHKSKRNKPWKI